MARKLYTMEKLPGIFIPGEGNMSTISRAKLQNLLCWNTVRISIQIKLQVTLPKSPQLPRTASQGRWEKLFTSEGLRFSPSTARLSGTSQLFLESSKKFLEDESMRIIYGWPLFAYLWLCEPISIVSGFLLCSVPMLYMQIFLIIFVSIEKAGRRNTVYSD